MEKATPQIPVRGLAEDLERGLIPLAVVGSDGLLDIIEFDDHDALDEPGFICFRRIPPEPRIVPRQP